MRVVISRWGSHGDVLPYLAVGWALAQRGHAVTFVGNPYFEARVVDAGLTFVGVGAREDHQRLMDDGDVWSRHRKTPEQIYADHYYPRVTAHFEAVIEEVAAGAAVVVAGDIGGIMAAERAGAPFVSIAVSPATSRFAISRYDPSYPERVLPAWAAMLARSGTGLRMMYALNAARRRRGRRPQPAPPLPDDHPIARLRAANGLPSPMRVTPRLALCLWPDWFAAPQKDWPATALTTGFPFYPPPTESTPAATGPLPIVVTTGSVAGSQHRFYETAVEACRTLGRSAVLVSPHREHIPEHLPPGISYVAFAPFSELLNQASLVIHHGGIGTASYGLAAGIPQLVLPMRGDQFDNGNRLSRLGVAQMLDGRATSSARLAQAIARLTGSRQTEARCRFWQTRTDTRAGLAGAASAIEALNR